MLNLHIHTHHSDGMLEVADILKLAEEAGLQYISITDHNTLDAYEDIQTGIFSGKIINGIEIECGFDHCGIEILGYGFDLEKLKNSDFMKRWFPISFRKHYIKRLEDYKDICREMGIKFDEKLELGRNAYANVALIKDILKYPENEVFFEKLGITDLDNVHDEFFEKNVSNKDSPFYDAFWFNEKPNICEAADAIKSAGGKVFLAHPFRYKLDGKELIDKLVSLNLLDGIECINEKHPSGQVEYLIDYCDKHNLLKSGGSDFHRPIGYNRASVMGYGNSNKEYPINLDLVKDWIPKFLPASHNKAHIDRLNH